MKMDFLQGKLKTPKKKTKTSTKKTKSSTKKTKSSTKKTKSPKRTAPTMKDCLETLNALPFADDGALTYIDGNTKGCRILHAVFAKTNPDHCPHISFEADEDVNDLVKCNESKRTLPTDLFTEEQLGLFTYASNLLGLGDSGIDIKLEACPGF